jgi:EamA domain-containing membrane protein RarD
VGVLLLGEHFSRVQLVAYGVALAGVVLATWPSGSTSLSS